MIFCVVLNVKLNTHQIQKGDIQSILVIRIALRFNKTFYTCYAKRKVYLHTVTTSESVRVVSPQTVFTICGSSNGPTHDKVYLKHYLPLHTRSPTRALTLPCSMLANFTPTQASPILLNVLK